LPGSSSLDTRSRDLFGNPSAVRRDLKRLPTILSIAAVKDEFDREGWIVTSGSALFKDNVSKENHPVLDKLLRAGGILHVQTTAPELFLIAVCWTTCTAFCRQD
jgi:Asp-tRNA(Asn)/Glu-tRNA(Gln) amidotransferase A subunit family amidase